MDRMDKSFDYSRADKSGVSLGSNWGILDNGVLFDVVEERTVPSVVHRIFEESKMAPAKLFVLGRFIHDGLTLKEIFLYNEVWNLIQNGKIGVLGAEYLDRYHASLGLPAHEHWVLLSDREEAYHQYVIMKKF